MRPWREHGLLACWIHAYNDFLRLCWNLGPVGASGSWGYWGVFCFLGNLSDNNRSWGFRFELLHVLKLAPSSCETCQECRKHLLQQEMRPLFCTRVNYCQAFFPDAFCAKRTTVLAIKVERKWCRIWKVWWSLLFVIYTSWIVPNSVESHFKDLVPSGFSAQFIRIV